MGFNVLKKLFFLELMVKKGEECVERIEFIYMVDKD